MLPLEGVRVVDLSAIISGPMATQMLADQGAEVIKIEQPGLGDLCRYLGPQKNGVGAMFASVNRNKRSLALNLKAPAGKAVLLDLVKSADVFVENFRPGAIERLGLTYKALREINPDLIYVSMSGFGDHGPYHARRVYDPIIQAVSGFADSQAGPDGAPQLIQTIVCDKIAAITAAQAISSALYAKAKGKGGVCLTLNMLDSTLAFLWPDIFYNHIFTGAFQKSVDFSHFYSIRKTKDGYVTAIVIADDEFQALTRAIGAPDLAADPRFKTLIDRMANAELLTAMVGDALARYTTAEVAARLGAEDVPHARVLTRDEVLTDPQVLANRIIVDVEDPKAGTMHLVRDAAQFGDAPSPIRRHAPGLGENSDEILRELGRTPADIATLSKSGAVA